jgi:hypothetical protein
MPKDNEVTPTEVQINYLKATDPLVRAAVKHPSGVENEKQFSKVQIEAINSAQSEVVVVINKIQRLTESLNEEEANLCLVLAATRVETADEEVNGIWEAFSQKEPQQAKKLFPIINQLKVLLAELKQREVDLEEYFTMAD